MRVLTLCLLLAVILVVVQCGKGGNGRGNSGKSKSKGNSRTDKLDKPANNNRDKARRAKINDLVDDVEKNGKKESKKDAKGNSLRKTKAKTDKHGNKHARLEQKYNDMRVLGAEVIVEDVLQDTEVEIIDKQTGEATGERKIVPAGRRMRGRYVGDIDRDIGDVTADQFDSKKALKNFKKSKAKGPKTKNEKSEVIVYVDGDTETAQVGYLVGFSDDNDGSPSSPTAILGADGTVIAEWDNIKSGVVQMGTGPGGNEKVGEYRYGQDYGKIWLTELGGGLCSFETADVKTVNLENTWDSNKEEAHTFPCFEQIGDEINGGYSPLNDAQFFGQKVFHLYDSWYGVRPYEDKLTLKVHYGENYDNAFFNSDSKEMVFGDGGSYFHPLVALDVITHEVSHGLTDQESKLVYFDESGALNEAFSDAAGKAAERFLYGNYWDVKWQVASDVVKSGSLRCMDDPTCDGLSVAHTKDYYYGMDVHYGSGIFNKVFHSLSQKFSYDIWDAFDLFFVANTEYWTPTTNFEEAGEGILKGLEAMQSGHHLPWGYSWISIQDIVDSLSEVGIQCSNPSGTWDCVKDLF